ncbi:hypothetical protein ACTQ6A_14220 [Lachnospiraceae bacterium LCP25S3_G4]
MKNKFKKLIEFGADIEFSYNNARYVISPFDDEGNIVMGKEYDDDNDQIFSNYDDFFEKGIVEGESVSKIIDKFDITFTSGCPDY